MENAPSAVAALRGVKDVGPMQVIWADVQRKAPAALRGIAAAIYFAQFKFRRTKMSEICSIIFYSAKRQLIHSVHCTVRKCLSTLSM